MSKAPRADVEDEEDEDIHSDDEFSFVEDQKNYAPGRSLTGHPNFTVQIGSSQGNGDVNSSGNLSNQIPNLGDTDFVQLMEDFKGFGASPSASVPDPPDVPAVLITSSISKELDKTDESTSKSEITKLEDGKSVSTENSGIATTANHGSKQGDGAVGKLSSEHRERVPSTGQYVKLSEAQEEAKAIGETLDAAKAADNDDAGEDVKAVDDALDAAFDADLDNKEDSKPSDVMSNSIGNNSAEYISFVNSSPSQAKVLDSDSDNEKKANGSYSLFSPPSSDAQSPDKIEEKKIVNLKPKLPYPVLLVTAGEGHLDQRRKKQETKGTEPRIMIWQIN